MATAWRRARGLLVGASVALLVALIAVPRYAPEVLAFPHLTRIGETHVHSTSPLDDGIADVLREADALVASAPGGWTPPPRRIFLTDGGWRWSVLAITSHGAFGFTPPLSNVVVITRSDVEADAVTVDRAVGNRRSLSGVIAHETMHLLIDDRYGMLRVRFLPDWKVEGFADHVARESSLSEADAARLRAAGEDHPALVYFDGRRRVAALLDLGVGVDELFLGR